MAPRPLGQSALMPVNFTTLPHFSVSSAINLPKSAGESDPPPLKWSDLRYVFDIKEDCNGKEAIQA